MFQKIAKVEECKTDSDMTECITLYVTDSLNTDTGFYTCESVSIVEDANSKLQNSESVYVYVNGEYTLPNPFYGLNLSQNITFKMNRSKLLLNRSEVGVIGSVAPGRVLEMKKCFLTEILR